MPARFLLSRFIYGVFILLKTRFFLPWLWILSQQPALLQASPADSAQNLVLQEALVLAWPTPLEPSGLAWCQGHLLMIADNQDQLIFEIHPEADEARRITVYKTLINIPPPPLPKLPWSLQTEQQISALFSPKTYDWEAISCDNQGAIWLASERFIALLRIDPKGSTSWLDVEIYQAGFQAGLFQVNNGFIEGLAWQAPNLLFIAAERQQRGILMAELTDKTRAKISSAQTLTDSDQTQHANRPADFSDLWIEADALYTLERNHFAICRRTLLNFKTERCWSYAATENSPEYRYPENHYGIAEGLARIGKQLYIVVDNNQKNRLKTGQNDAMLFIYTLPEDW